MCSPVGQLRPTEANWSKQPIYYGSNIERFFMRPIQIKNIKYMSAIEIVWLLISPIKSDENRFSLLFRQRINIYIWHWLCMYSHFSAHLFIHSNRWRRTQCSSYAILSPIFDINIWKQLTKWDLYVLLHTFNRLCNSEVALKSKVLSSECATRILCV